MFALRTLLLSLGAVACLLHGVSASACTPLAETRASLQKLKAENWQLADDAQRQQMGLQILDCLAQPDPVLRDALAFEALQAWMRSKQLSVPTVHLIRRILQDWIKPGTPDASGFRQPFAALVLAEVARMDRLQPFLSADERQELLHAATAYLANVRDYRGFQADQGWRHGVAHGADLMLQLSLNPQLERAQLDQILTAIASQVAPAGAHFYLYREGERLMAPVFYVARRGLHGAADWETWFVQLASGKQTANATQEGLARRHNFAGFLLPLYFALQETPDAAQRERLLAAVGKTLKGLDR